MKKIAIILTLAVLILLCGCSSNEIQKEDASTTGASSVLEENPSNPIPLKDFTTQPNDKEEPESKTTQPNGDKKELENQITQANDDKEKSESKTEANKLPIVDDNNDSTTVEFTIDNSESTTKKEETTEKKNEELSTTGLQDFEMPRIPIS